MVKVFKVAAVALLVLASAGADASWSKRDKAVAPASAVRIKFPPAVGGPKFHRWLKDVGDETSAWHRDLIVPAAAQFEEPAERPDSQVSDTEGAKPEGGDRLPFGVGSAVRRRHDGVRRRRRERASGRPRGDVPRRRLHRGDVPPVPRMAGTAEAWRYFGANPFGHSGRRIADFYAGLVGDFRSTQKWKRLRRTKHDHHPVHDALGNAEALIRIFEGER